MTQNALITGASGKLGSTITRHLAQKQFNQALHCNHGGNSLKQLIKKVESEFDVSVKPYSCNFCQTKTIPLFFKHAYKDFKSFNLLINNASAFDSISFLDTTDTQIEKHLSVNFTAPLILSREFSKHADTPCHIINILDARITRNKTKDFIYLFSKKMLTELTRMMAVELSPLVRVNAIAVGTLVSGTSKESSLFKKIKPSLPMQNHPTLNQFAHALDFLMDTADITGQIIYIDGGLSL